MKKKKKKTKNRIISVRFQDKPFNITVMASLAAQTVNVGDPGLIAGLGRSPGGENGNPLQYSCLENPMDRGAW